MLSVSSAAASFSANATTSDACSPMLRITVVSSPMIASEPAILRVWTRRFKTASPSVVATIPRALVHMVVSTVASSAPEKNRQICLGERVKL
jgi:hypothetical protein